MYYAECMFDVCVDLTDMINVFARLYVFGLNETYGARGHVCCALCGAGGGVCGPSYGVTLGTPIDLAQKAVSIS